MAIPQSILDLEKAKFIDSSGNVAIRVVATTATLGSGDGLSDSILDLEKQKFIEDDNGDVAIILTAV